MNSHTEMITIQAQDEKGRFTNEIVTTQIDPTNYVAQAQRMVTPKRWRSIVRRAIREAKAGDRHARDWLTKVIFDGVASTAPAERTQLLQGLEPRELVREIVRLGKRVKAEPEKT